LQPLAVDVCSGRWRLAVGAKSIVGLLCSRFVCLFEGVVGGEAVHLGAELVVLPLEVHDVTVQLGPWF